MRISDWSSDVCSSDLNIAAFYNDLTNQQLQYGYVSPTAQTTTTIANAGKSRIAGVEVESFMQLVPGLTWAVSYSYLDTKLIKAEDRSADVERSEEHTSELQSLMRISYAVFCLKKKKKNTEIDTSNIEQKTTNDKSRKN